MSINPTVKAALINIGVPVSFQKYSGTESTYITYFCYNEQGEAYAENVEIETGYYIQVDVWSKGDYTALVDQVASAMKTAGFSKRNFQDLYEKDTKIYHKAMRFVYI